MAGSRPRGQGGVALPRHRATRAAPSARRRCPGPSGFGGQRQAARRSGVFQPCACRPKLSPVENIGGTRGTNVQTDPRPGRQDGGGRGRGGCPRVGRLAGRQGPPAQLPGAPDGCKARQRLSRTYSRPLPQRAGLEPGPGVNHRRPSTLPGALCSAGSQSRFLPYLKQQQLRGADRAAPRACALGGGEDGPAEIAPGPQR